MTDSTEWMISTNTRSTITLGRRWCSRCSWMVGHPHHAILILLSSMKTACTYLEGMMVITETIFTGSTLLPANGARSIWKQMVETVYGPRADIAHRPLYIKIWCFCLVGMTAQGNSTTSTASTSVTNLIFWLYTSCRNVDFCWISDEYFAMPQGHAHHGELRQLYIFVRRVNRESTLWFFRI